MKSRFSWKRLLLYVTFCVAWFPVLFLMCFCSTLVFYITCNWSIDLIVLAGTSVVLLLVIPVVVIDSRYKLLKWIEIKILDSWDIDTTLLAVIIIVWALTFTTLIIAESNRADALKIHKPLLHKKLRN